jgi:predicted NUDIX family NTP pyrophosphohydrolase
MPVQSAGILLFRQRKSGREVFLVHPGGPFWRHKNLAAWTIPKGTIEPNEAPLDAARREFKEETGFDVDGDFKLLGTFKQPGGKLVTAFAVEGDVNPDKLASNSFSVMWPPQSGKYAKFPEIDRGEWFGREEAEQKILKGQKSVLEVFFDG